MLAVDRPETNASSADIASEIKKDKVIPPLEEE